MKNLQQAADDAAVIAETVETLGKLLDKFHAEHGTELYERLEKVWPDAVNFGGTAAKPIYKFSDDLTPPDDADRYSPNLVRFVMFGQLHADKR